MDRHDAAVIGERLSTDRFATYLQACDGDAQQAMRLYTWNVEVSGALWGPIVAVEVLVRNLLHQSMSRLVGQEAWWDHPRGHLIKPSSMRVAEARRRLLWIGSPSTPDAVVAELPFGFWVSLLAPGDDYENRFWRAGVGRTFPHYRGGRKDLHRRLNHIRLLRNRIAHHEPVFGRDLARDHESLLTAIAYGCQSTHDWVQGCTRVPRVLAERATLLDGTRPLRF